MHLRAALKTTCACLVLAEQDAKQGESDWAKRLPDALKFLFADWKPEPEANDAGKQ